MAECDIKCAEKFIFFPKVVVGSNSNLKRERRATIGGLDFHSSNVPLRLSLSIALHSIRLPRDRLVLIRFAF